MRGTPDATTAIGKADWIIPAYAGNTRTSGRRAMAVGDHPRVCGEHQSDDGERAGIRGSSPRMRGTPVRLRRRQSVHVDHPRVCGEHDMMVINSLEDLGSSPRMRGTQMVKGCAKCIGGIIPAYAGNTCRPIRKRSPIRDHPRVCGEHITTIIRRRSNRGSSPRMRGTHRCRSGQRHCKGIIPAYAGNTVQVFCDDLGARDHPRVCGEHGFQRFLFVVIQGSSPRMRGTLQRRAHDVPSSGIIPAYAGNTPLVYAQRSEIPGSSPRMRGTQVRRRTLPIPHGIIPAYAGNTRYLAIRFQQSGDHPRVCGEHGGVDFTVDKPEGSSPRMRGTPGDGFAGFFRHGIIPAYAGNTNGSYYDCKAYGDHPRVCGEHPHQ